MSLYKWNPFLASLEYRMARLEAPDELLVVAAILGNLAAFEELVLRYYATGQIFRLGRVACPRCSARVPVHWLRQFPQD